MERSVELLGDEVGEVTGDDGAQRPGDHDQHPPRPRQPPSRWSGRRGGFVALRGPVALDVVLELPEVLELYVLSEVCVVLPRRGGGRRAGRNPHRQEHHQHGAAERDTGAELWMAPDVQDRRPDGQTYQGQYGNDRDDGPHGSHTVSLTSTVAHTQTSCSSGPGAASAGVDRAARRGVRE
jgi:hypothetical protein